MGTRVPQDVDLEDKLIYGLTPLHFGYLVVAVIFAAACWGLHALPLGVRLPLCTAALGGGAALAWGRWGGRPLDRWLLDAALFVRRNYRLEFHARLPRRARAAAAADPLAARLAALDRLRAPWVLQGGRGT